MSVQVINELKNSRFHGVAAVPPNSNSPCGPLLHVIPSLSHPYFLSNPLAVLSSKSIKVEKLSLKTKHKFNVKLLFKFSLGEECQRNKHTLTKH